MREIVLASANRNKIRELQALLTKEIGDGFTVLSLSDIGFKGEIDENGKTFEENAMIKARAVAKLGYIGVGDDSGLSVNALSGAPGVFSARYAGEHGNDALNNEKLLREMEGTGDRRASFVCVLACAFPEDEKKNFTVRGECPGDILLAARGTDGFGYDPLFFYPPLGKTFAELTVKEKNEISHRGRAMRLFAEKLKKNLT